MSEKLTAKLSDGRKYEVVNDMSACSESDSENRVMWLKPIKPQPPKDVWVNIYPHTDKAHAHDTQANADLAARRDRIGCYRYVLAEGDKPKREPREWYEVRTANSTAYAPNLEQAKLVKEAGCTIFLVREVLE